ncbi:hypothetical protein [Variovorax sp. YR216]|uniref:hypothetical protein n=1 Tax=Variovorax sp. YR216 TaxID=1882828 RepID=UPI000899B604|nr:hypothetical protein [Variovorax sp. YR216]SEA53901.1 hypothetical protein SAMN05444680_102821 [Variovorax sp. YR216]
MSAAGAIYCFDTATVRFAIYPTVGRRVIAEISEDPLRDFFGADGGGESLVEAYERNAPLINARAIERHFMSGGRPVVLESADFDLPVHDAC